MVMTMMVMGLMMAIRKKGLEGGHPSKHKPLTHYLSFKVMMVIVMVIKCTAWSNELEHIRKQTRLYSLGKLLS